MKQNKNYQLLKEIFQLEEEAGVNKNKKSFVSAVCAMDIKNIENILDDDRTYQDTTKTIFIEKLKEVFANFKSEDSKLLAYDGSCRSLICLNTNQKGVLFVGNNSGRYLNLLIEEDDVGAIIDLYNCNDFCATKKNIDTSKKELYIYIRDYEKVGSAANNRYDYSKIRFVNGTNNPANEYPLATINLIYEWLAIHDDVFRASNYPVYNFENKIEFHQTYWWAQDLYKLLVLEEDASAAIAEYKKIDSNNKAQLLEWLGNYEKLYTKLEEGAKIEKARDGFLKEKEKFSKLLELEVNKYVIKNGIHFIALFKIYDNLNLDNCDLIRPE